MHLVDSLGKTPGLDYVCCLHEQAAAIAAEAYAQNRNSLGVTLVTAGPGSTNALTGVAGAWIDSTPMLILSGQAKTTELMHDYKVRQMGIQEVDTAAIAAPVTKYAKCVTDPAAIRFELEKALYLAMHGMKPLENLHSIQQIFQWFQPFRELYNFLLCLLLNNILVSFDLW